MIYEGSTVKGAIGLALGNKAKRFGKNKWSGQRQKPNAAKTRAANESEASIRESCNEWWRQYQDLLCEIDLHRKTRDCLETERDQIYQHLERIENEASRIGPNIPTLPRLNRHSAVLKQKGRGGRRPSGGTSASNRRTDALTAYLADLLEIVTGEQDRRRLRELQRRAARAQSRLANVESKLSIAEDYIADYSQRIAALGRDPRMNQCRGIGDSTVGQYYCDTLPSCGVLTR